MSASPQRPRLLAAGALGIAWVVFYARQIFTSQAPFDRDVLVTTLPLREYLRSRLLKGELPQWYPNEMLGLPFIGGIVNSPFHPQTLLLVLFNAVVATKWSLLLASLGGLIGAYRLSRTLGASRPGAVLGAYSFAFGGYAISMTNNPPFLAPLATAPWAIAATIHVLKKQRLRDSAVLGLTWALVFLGGDAQLTAELMALSGAALLVTGPSKVKAGLLALSALVAVLLAAPELLPSLVVGAESFRPEWQISPELTTRWALHPLELPGLISPGFSPSLWQSNLGRLVYSGKEGFWASSLFVGALPLALLIPALAKRERTTWLLLEVAVLFLWLALGGYGSLLPALWQVVPPLSMLRFPEKYFAVTCLLLAPLVALGFDAVRLSPGRPIRSLALLALLMFVMARWSYSGGFIAATIRASHHSLARGDLLWNALHDAWPQGFVTSGLVLVVAALLLQVGRTRPSVVLLLVPLTFIELWIAHASHIPLASEESLLALSPLATYPVEHARNGAPPGRVLPLPADAPVSPNLVGDERVAALHALVRPSDGGRGGTPVFDHDLPAEPGRSLRLFFGKPPPVDPAVWAPFFNACYRVTPTGASLGSDARAVVTDAPHNAELIEQACRPRAFLSAAVGAPDAREALEAMRAGLPDETVVWEGGPARPLAHGAIRWLQTAPEHLRLEVDSDGPSALVVTDAFASGWSAAIDGISTPLFATDVAARGVAVDAGKHQIAFDYRTPFLKLGMALFVLGLALVSGLLLRRRDDRARR